MKKLIVANWKMNPLSTKEAVLLAKKELAFGAKAHRVEVVVCPPFIYLSQLSSLTPSRLSGTGRSGGFRIALGAQNCAGENKGAYTGEISPLMLKNVGAHYVIAGHSERRALGETDDMIAKKVFATLRAGLTPILCVGEPLGVRTKGIAEAKKFVASQLKKSLALVSHFPLSKSQRICIAYEPIWSISTSGTGKIDTPESAVEMIEYIKTVASPILSYASFLVLYGGSVNPQNASGFLSRKEIDGVLVGGASLDAKQFAQVIAGAM